MNFQEKTVIVTGASSGIGKTVAAAYVARGANVVLADLKQQEGKRHAAALKQAGGSALFVKADVGVEHDVKHLVRQTVETFGAVHILINNAGVSRFKPFLKLSLAEWNDLLRTNLTSMFLCAREAARYMRKNKDGGAIVNIASTRAIMAEPGNEAYATSKGGILGFTQALAVSLGPDRIRVNAVLPGWIQNVNYEKLRDVDHAQHPAGRVGRPEDVALACMYLSHPANEFVTGTHLIVDGGMTRKMIYAE